jgi:hypothetical protein
MEKVNLNVEMVEIPMGTINFQGKLLLSELHQMGMVKTIPEAITLIECRCVWVDREVVTDFNFRLPKEFELIVGNRGVRVRGE